MKNADRWSLAVLAAMLLIAFALRAPQLGESLWLDELHTAWVVDGGLREIPPRAAVGNQSPLYFVLPWLTTRIFGLSEFALRLPSLVAGLAVIVAIYALVWRMTASHAGALLAAWLAAIEPNFLWYSLEARPYAWVQLVGVLQVITFWQTWNEPTWRRWATMLVLSIALFYLHYTSALLFTAEFLYLISVRLLIRQAPKYSITALFIDVGIAALACLPASFHLQSIAQRRDAWWKFVPREPDAAALLTMFPLGVTVVLPLIIAAVCWLMRSRRSQGPAHKLPVAPFWFVFLWLAVPLLCAFFATRLGLAPLWMRRYVMVSAAAPLVGAGAVCSAIDSRTMRIIAAILVALAATWALGPQRQYWHDGRWVARPTQDWRAAIAEINRDDDTTSPVLLRSGFIEADSLNESGDKALVEYCVLPARSIYQLRGDERVVVPLTYSRPGRLLAADAERIAAHQRVWLITPGDGKTKDATLSGLRLAMSRQNRAMSVLRTENFGGVWVVKILSTEY